LAEIKGLRCLTGVGEVVANYAYFPILVEADFPLSRDALFQKFRDQNIYVRRYFYPLISDFSMYRGLPSAAPANLPVARRMAEQVLCLPIYPDLQDVELETVLTVLQDVYSGHVD
jgi:dTDP-4-amino-4,6-dideoxygalactose transaminase